MAEINMAVEQLWWVEKFRPKTVSQCVLPKELSEIFLGMVASKHVPNLLLCGSPGTGKTTVAKALCEELQYDYIFINASLERGIDTVRQTIIDHACTISLDGSRKVVILDEADNLTGDAQDALRGCIEQYSKNCGFILTCNFKNKIKDPLQSRFSHVDFKITKEDKAILLPEMVKHAFGILDAESVEYNKKAVMQVVAQFFPDFRRAINELQKYSKMNGKINEGILTNNLDANMTGLFKALKDKKYQEVRQWVASNNDNDASALYRKFFDSMDKFLTPRTVPVAVLHIGNYMFRTHFADDPEIMFLSFTTEILRDCEFQ